MRTLLPLMHIHKPHAYMHIVIPRVPRHTNDTLRPAQPAWDTQYTQSHHTTRTEQKQTPRWNRASHSHANELMFPHGRP